MLACTGVLTSTLPARAQDAKQVPEAPEEGADAMAPAGPVEESAPDAPPPVEENPEDDAFAAEQELQQIVVTGFRGSLGAALQRKQSSTAQVDAVVADDIADFPDLNLAEALQRMPGVAITRQNGEGNQITVRGLSGLYTRTRINGMDTRASIAGNAGRAFDFNLFASELFNSIVVHKTASASLGEGSLGAVVDLNTGRAFNYDEGFTFLAGAEGVYNDLSTTVRPRATGLIAYHDPGGRWGATASVAYSSVRLDVATSDTVRWQKAPFNSVNGVVCADNPADPGCAEVADAFHARIPRYGYNEVTTDRLGVTAGLQWRPTDAMEIRLDALYATYDRREDFRTIEVLFRGNEAGIDVTSYALEPFPARFGVGNNTLIAMNVNNAWVRSEAYRAFTDTRFHQVTLALDYDFTDDIYARALGGTSRSKAQVPHATTLMYDDRDYDGYSYDYRASTKLPVLAFNGPDVTDAANFTLTELRDALSETKNAFDVGELHLHWDILDPLRLAAGVKYNVASLDTAARDRNGTVCALGLYDCDTDDDGMDDVLGPQGTPELTNVYAYPGDVGAGSNRRWASPSLDGWVNTFDYYNTPLQEDLDSTYTVEEKNLGYYLQATGEIPLGAGDMRLLYDGGMRYVETRQTSGGFVEQGDAGIVFVEVERPVYRDWLPAANAALWFTDELVLRLAAARVMARPQLGNLRPSGAVDSFNFTINFQNPNLDPTRATALDAAIEWYFDSESILALALFTKDIESFPIRQSRTGTFASTDLPAAVIAPTSPASQTPEGICGNPEGCWEISELTNGPGATVKGLEIAFQAPFSAFYSALPPVIRGMGFIGNVTLVDSDTSYDFSGNTVKERLIDLSNQSYNATLYYEDSKLSSRISLATRSDYLQAGPNANGNLWEFVEDNTRLDFSSSYNLTENLQISLEALNLTDAHLDVKVDIDANRRLRYDRTGRNFLLGARYTL